MEYWLFRNDNTEGPFSIDKLQTRLNAGELSPEDKICPMGETEWRSLSTIATPPPPPGGEIPPPPPVSGDVLPAPSALPDTPAARRRSRTITFAAAAVVVTGIATALVYLLNDPSRPLPKTASYVPKDSVLVVTTHVGDLLEKGNINDLLGKGILQDFEIPRNFQRKIKD